MSKQTSNIIDRFLSNIWLWEKVFGKLLPYVVWDRKREGAKKVLSKIYKFEDVESLFDKSIDKKEFTKHSKILFQIFDKTDEK